MWLRVYADIFPALHAGLSWLRRLRRCGLHACVWDMDAIFQLIFERVVREPPQINNLWIHGLYDSETGSASPANDGLGSTCLSITSSQVGKLQAFGCISLKAWCDYQGYGLHISMRVE